MSEPLPLVVGQPVLIVVDIQGGAQAEQDGTPEDTIGQSQMSTASNSDTSNSDPAMPETSMTETSMPFMADYDLCLAGAPALVAEARACQVPVIFFQEAHRRDLVDFGRELDGAEGIHLLEGDPGTEVSASLGMLPDDYFIRKRRYSCFFGTELEILLKGLNADTLILIGGHTDVCIHYTFVDGHQHDYFCRVVEDCVAGSSTEAHEASLRAMEYLQTGARRRTTEVVDAFRSYALDLSTHSGSTP